MDTVYGITDALVALCCVVTIDIYFHVYWMNSAKFW